MLPQRTSTPDGRPSRIGQDAVLKAFSFSVYMTLAVIVTYFPIYFDSIGYSKMQIGLLYSIGPTVGIVSNLFWGLVSDRFQTLKKTILGVLAGQLVMVLLLFQYDAFGVLFVIMTGFYFFQSPLNGLNDSQILLAVNATGKSYASYRVWGSVGFAFASVLFGQLLARLGMELVAPLTMSAVALSLALALFLKEARQGLNKMDFSGLRSVILSRRLLWFLLLVLLMSAAHRANDGFLALYMRELGADKDKIGLALMASSLSEVPVFFLLSRYGHKFRELPLLSVASFVYAARFWLMSIVSSPDWVVVIQLMHSLSFGIFLFTALRYIQELVPDKFRATGQAVFQVTWGGFAGLISGFIGGKLFDLWGGQQLYLFATVSAVLAGGGFLLTHLLQKEV